MQADVCGFWSFPRLSPTYRPPERLARFLTMCEAEAKPVFVVGLGSMPELGLVKVQRLVIRMVLVCSMYAVFTNRFQFSTSEVR